MKTDENVSAETDRRDQESLMVQAMAEYRAQLDAGNRPDREQVLAKYPELADELATCFQSLEFIHTVAPQLADEPQTVTEDGKTRLHPLAVLGDLPNRR